MAAIPETSGSEAETTESNVKVVDRNRVVEYISAMRPIRQTSETFLQYVYILCNELVPDMEVTEIILAEVSRVCQLTSPSRGFLSRL